MACTIYEWMQRYSSCFAMENSLIDACVVIGVDEDTGLLPAIRASQYSEDGSSSLSDGTLFLRPYQLQVVAVMDGFKALFPHSTKPIEGGTFYKQDKITCPYAQGSSPSSLKRAHSLAPLGNFAIGSFTAEVIASLPTFCMPRGGYVHSTRQPAHTHHLVLTDIDGNRSYATCLVTYRPFVVSGTAENQPGIFDLTPVDEPQDDADSTDGPASLIYAPFLVCVSSCFPYFGLMRDCLSPLAKCLQDDRDPWPQILKFSSQITGVPVPPPGPLSIEFELFGVHHILYPSDEVGRPLVESNLQIPLLLLSIDDVISVIASILTQQRIIFLGADYGIITVVIETFFAYIKPFQWRLTYVPVLPVSLSDLIEAPGPFIMGCHSSIFFQVKQVRSMEEVPAIVVVDLDKGKVDFDPKASVPMVPDWVVQGFKIRLKKLQLHFDLDCVSSLGFSTIEEWKMKRRTFQHGIDQIVKAACIDMMVSLFGDVISYMRFGEAFFDKDAYLQTRLPQERLFYEEVCCSDSFERFIEERLSNPQQRDVFAVLSERLGSKMPSSRSRSSSSVNKLSKVSSFGTVALFKPPETTFKLPPLLDEGLHTGTFYKMLREKLDGHVAALDSRSVSIKASYLYLRGMVEVACDEPIRALRDFHRLHAANQELVPKDYVSRIMSVLDDETKKKLEQQEFYASMSAFRVHARRSEEGRVLGPRRKMPSSALHREAFVQRVRTLQITLSDDAAEVLFDVLTHDVKPKLVQAEQFSYLYNTLAEKEAETNRFETPGMKLSAHDTPLKISPMINTTWGMGRLILTYHELRFAGEGVRATKLITRLHDVKEVIKFQHFVVFPPGVPALRIVNRDRNILPFFACLKTDRDLWVLLLNEMSNGHELAHMLKDPKIVDMAANSATLTDVLFTMNLPTEALCFHWKRQNTELEKLSPQTRETLERRLDPCVREAKRSTVMAILFLSTKGRNEQPTLWCGMGSGAIMVYETESWTCVSELRYAKNRISCLLTVGNKYVWAGSYDTMIYVISTDHRKAEQQLQSHKDFVSDLLLTECSVSDAARDDDEMNRRVLSASVNGQITEWNPDARQIVRQFQLKKVYTLRSLLLVRDTLWCVTSDAIVVVDMKSGQPIDKMRILNDSGLPVSIECALYLPSTQKVWTGCGKKGEIAIWDIDTRQHEIETASEDAMFSVFLLVENNVWAGDQEGMMTIINSTDCSPVAELHAHTDFIYSMTHTNEGHVISGSASGEGKMCVWNSMRRDPFESVKSLGFELVDGKRVFTKKGVQRKCAKK